jgi:DNA invertase Pin-like site-specific DNA recombinase
MVAFAYLRVSTPDQAVHGMSLDGQLAEIERFAAAKGIRIARVFTEAGVSAQDDGRPEFRRMMDEVYSSACTVGLVVVVHTSRFMRNALSARLYKARLRKLDVAVVSVQQTFGDDPTGRFAEIVQEAADQLQSDEGAVRTRAGMLATVRAGFFVGSQPPFGFRVVPAMGPGGAPKKKLEVDPTEADVAREACTLYLARGAVAVASTLNARGLLYRSKLWDRDRVLRIISDPALTGTYIWGRTDSRTGRARPPEDRVGTEVEVIVDRQVFDRVQILREQRDPDRNPGREASSPMLLAGLVICSHCGARYQLQTAGKPRPDGSRYSYYQCSAARRRGVGKAGSCPGRPVPMEALNAAVTESLVAAVFRADRCRTLLRDLVESDGLLRQRLAADRRHWERAGADMKRRCARLMEAIETSDPLPAGLVSRLAEAEGHLRDIVKKLARIAVVDAAPPWLHDATAAAAFQVHMTRIVRADPAIVRAYLHSLGCRVTVGRQGISVSSRPVAVADPTPASAATPPTKRRKVVP